MVAIDCCVHAGVGVGVDCIDSAYVLFLGRTLNIIGEGI
jgi:hypothetical protein